MRPDTIEPNLAPGGVVVRLYRAVDDQLLREARLTSMDQVDPVAHDDYDATRNEGSLIFTVYDGDTGHRMILPPTLVSEMARSFGLGTREDLDRWRDSL